MKKQIKWKAIIRIIAPIGMVIATIIILLLVFHYIGESPCPADHRLDGKCWTPQSKDCWDYSQMHSVPCASDTGMFAVTDLNNYFSPEEICKSHNGTLILLSKDLDGDYINNYRDKRIVKQNCTSTSLQELWDAGKCEVLSETCGNCEIYQSFITDEFYCVNDKHYLENGMELDTRKCSLKHPIPTKIKCGETSYTRK